MRGLEAKDILDLWDHGVTMGDASRALAVLARADTDVSNAEMAALPVSDRDARLLSIRALTLGPEMRIGTECAECGASIEITMTAEDIGLGARGARDNAPVTRSIGGREIVMRAVNAGDLAAVEHAPDVAAARALLLARCVLSVDGDATAAVPEAIVGELEAAFEALDPLADVQLSAACPDCGTAWSEPFDASRFFWQEIGAYVPRLLHEVAHLARHYHWSERDILAMPPARRRSYMEMAETREPVHP